MGHLRGEVIFSVFKKIKIFLVDKLLMHKIISNNLRLSLSKGVVHQKRSTAVGNIYSNNDSQSRV